VGGTDSRASGAGGTKRCGLWITLFCGFFVYRLGAVAEGVLLRVEVDVTVRVGGRAREETAKPCKLLELTALVTRRETAVGRNAEATTKHRASITTASQFIDILHV
jgi:hypothetical protein